MNNQKGAAFRVFDNITPSESAAWDEFVLNSSNSCVYHLYSWRYLIKKVFGHDGYYLCAKDRANQIVGVLPLIHMKSRLFGNFLISVPYFNYGGCVTDKDVVKYKLQERAVEIAKMLSVAHIEFRDLANDTMPEMVDRTDKISMRLELPSDADQLWSALGSKLRSQIKRPLRENPEVKIGGIELLDDFYKVFSQNMRDLGTPVYSVGFFRSILEMFEEHCNIVNVYKDDKPVATGFLVGYKEMMEIPWASSLKEYNKLGFNMLMYWEALKISIERSCKVFDFGRSSHNSGTYRFKKQWGAAPIQLHWHYWLKDGGEVPMLNPSNPKYKMAINAWKRLPLPIANRIGPMLVKNLP